MNNYHRTFYQALLGIIATCSTGYGMELVTLNQSARKKFENGYSTFMQGATQYETASTPEHQNTQLTDMCFGLRTMIDNFDAAHAQSNPQATEKKKLESLYTLAQGLECADNPTDRKKHALLFTIQVEPIKNNVLCVKPLNLNNLLIENYSEEKKQAIQEQERIQLSAKQARLLEAASEQFIFNAHTLQSGADKQPILDNLDAMIACIRTVAQTENSSRITPLNDLKAKITSAENITEAMVKEWQKEIVYSTTINIDSRGKNPTIFANTMDALQVKMAEGTVLDPENAINQISYIQKQPWNDQIKIDALEHLWWGKWCERMTYLEKRGIHTPEKNRSAQKLSFALSAISKALSSYKTDPEKGHSSIPSLHYENGIITPVYTTEYPDPYDIGVQQSMRLYKDVPLQYKRSTNQKYREIAPYKTDEITLSALNTLQKHISKGQIIPKADIMALLAIGRNAENLSPECVELFKTLDLDNIFSRLNNDIDKNWPSHETKFTFEALQKTLKLKQNALLGRVEESGVSVARSDSTISMSSSAQDSKIELNRSMMQPDITSLEVSMRGGEQKKRRSSFNCEPMNREEMQIDMHRNMLEFNSTDFWKMSILDGKFVEPYTPPTVEDTSETKFVSAVTTLASKAPKYQRYGFPAKECHDEVMSALKKLSDTIQTIDQNSEAYKKFKELDLFNCAQHIFKSLETQEKEKCEDGVEQHLSASDLLLDNRGYAHLLEHNDSLKRAHWIRILQTNPFPTKSHNSNRLTPVQQEWINTLKACGKYIKHNSKDTTFKSCFSAIDLMQNLKHLTFKPSKLNDSVYKNISYKNWDEIYSTLNSLAQNTQASLTYNQKCNKLATLYTKNPAACTEIVQSLEDNKKEGIIKKILDCKEIDDQTLKTIAVPFDIFGYALDELEKKCPLEQNAYGTTHMSARKWAQRIAKVVDINHSRYTEFQELDLSALVNCCSPDIKKSMHNALAAHNPTLHKDYKNSTNPTITQTNPNPFYKRVETQLQLQSDTSAEAETLKKYLAVSGKAVSDHDIARYHLYQLFNSQNSAEIAAAQENFNRIDAKKIGMSKLIKETFDMRKEVPANDSQSAAEKSTWSFFKPWTWFTSSAQQSEPIKFQAPKPSFLSWDWFKSLVA